MRERSGTRTEHAKRRIPTLVTTTLAVVAGTLVAVPLPSLAAQTASGPGGTRGSVQPVAGSVGGTGETTVASTQTEVREVDVPEEATTSRERRDSGRDVVARLEKRDTDDFALVALTWRPDTAPDDFVAEIRTHAAGWSAWEELHYHAAEGPAPDEEPGATRDGTEPLWVEDADGVQVRVLSSTGTAPRDLEVTMIDPGAATASVVTPAVLTGAGASREATTVATAAPRLVSRRQWGADPRLKERCSSPRHAATLRMAFVHHTAGSNDYSRSQGPAIVRSIYAYHTQGRGWCDIGYNFLVDKFGTAYVGRAGGPNTPVRGAHAGDYNTWTTGVSLIGNFEERRPSRAMKRKLTRLLAWKLSSYYRSPRTNTRVAGERFERISGHRDAMSTACPGWYVYRWLPRLRDQVASRVGRIDTAVSRKWKALRSEGTNLRQPFRGEGPAAYGGRATQFNRGWIYWHRRTGAHPLWGRILGRWRSLGRAAGRLGYPRSDLWRIRQYAGVGQTFQRGRIYRRPGRTVALWGRIDLRYRHMGSVRGRLGVPTRDQYRVRRGWAAGFERGRITWNTSTGRVSARYY